MPPPRALVATPYRRGVIALLVITIAWRAWTVSRWSWQEDDWLYMDGTHDLGLGAYLFQDYNGHVMPGGFLITWVMTKLAPLDFRIPVVLVTLAFAVLVLVWAKALARLVGEHTLVLAPLSLLTLTPLLIRPTIWWASALQAVPLQLFIALTTLLAARVAREPRRGDVWRLAALFVLSLAFWQKSLLLLIPMSAVLIHLGAGPLTRRVRSAAAQMWVCALVAVGYLAAFLVYTAGESSSNSLEIDTSSVSPGDAVEFFSRGFGEIVAPALLGGPWGTLPTNSDLFVHQQGQVSFVLSALALMGTLYIVTRVRESWLLLGAGIAYVLAAWGLVLFSSRFVLSGQATSTTERFHTDGFAVTVVLLTLALSGLRVPALSGRHLSGTTATVLVAALVGSLTLGNVWQARRIGTSPAQPWVSAVIESTGDADAVSLWDMTAPDAVLPGFWLEHSHVTNMLAVLPNVTFGTPSPRMSVVLESGQVVPMAVKPGSGAAPGPVRDCGYSVEPGRTVNVPMTAELFDWTWAVQVDTLSAEGGELTLRTEETSVVLDIQPGLQSIQAPLSSPVGKKIQMSMGSDGGTVCVAGVTIGNAIAATP